MKSSLLGIVVALCSVFGNVPFLHAELFVIKDGVSHAQIVVAENPPRKTALAAKELQTYLTRITGATLPITTTPDQTVPVNIFVGHSTHTQSLNLDTKDLKHGAYKMVSGRNWLALIGQEYDYVPPAEPWGKSRTNAERARITAEWDAITGETYGVPTDYLFRMYHPGLDIWRYDGAGSLNAVYEYLRNLGVRWYMPGELGEIVPAKKSIALSPINRTVVADFPMRRLQIFYDTTPLPESEMLWLYRMGVEEGHDTIGIMQAAHGAKWVHIRPEFREKASPDLFAVWGGQSAINHHRTGAPCLSSEAFFNHHLKFTRKALDHYKLPMINLDMVDGYAFLCECEKCKKTAQPGPAWSSLLSNYVWGYVNRVALELHKSHPDRMVSGLAYSAYTEPPTNIEQLAPNVAVVFCQARSLNDNAETRDRYRRQRKAWFEKLPSKQIFLWEYYLEAWPARPNAGLPAYYTRIIDEDLKSLKGLSQGDMIELYRHRTPDEHPWNALAISHLNVYLTSQLWWDVDQDADKILEEYYTLFYGPAREPMKQFIEHCEKNWRAMRMKAEPIDQAFALLAKAQAAAGTDTVYARRVAMIAEFIKPMQQLRERLAIGRENNPQIRSVERRQEDIKLDGKLDDKIWKDVRTMDMRELTTGRSPENSTKVWFAWGGDSLYLGIRCEDRDAANLDLSPLRIDDPNVFKRDNIEILIETQVHSYYQIVVIPTGAIMDLDRGGNSRNTEWSSNATVVTSVDDKGWTAEIRIPNAGENARDLNPLLGIAGQKPTSLYPWHINICRQYVRKSYSELSAISPTGTTRFHDVMKFGALFVK